MTKTLKYTCSILLFFLLQNLKSQTELNNKQYYVAYDSIAKIQNSGLYNGSKFINEYRTSKSNFRFFKYYHFEIGDLIFDNQPFYNINLKYDLYKDLLVVKLNNNKSFFDLQLDSKKVSFFRLKNHSFYNFIENTSLKSIGVEGYIELIYKGDTISYYIKHLKKKKDKIKNNRVEHLFIKDSIHLVEVSNKFYEIKSQKDLKKLNLINENVFNKTYEGLKNLSVINYGDFIKKLIVSIDKLSATYSSKSY
ncbi:hypothetical protein [Mangrovimonas spongiae]|uniref:Uncharacterized protein n=1 Tax=Mangrovimonas spongiae TaxID=2494697 RepID=A0A3R9NVU1_9FLAO|nr:hypothetical protein [Mangrovimonas spongiae]RSK38736.1 hypothetical protein EJA19_11815 [Mangrovimonas spongiae]